MYIYNYYILIFFKSIANDYDNLPIRREYLDYDLILIFDIN